MRCDKHNEYMDWDDARPVCDSCWREEHANDEKARVALELVPELVEALWSQHYDLSDSTREYFCLGSCDIGHDRDCTLIREVLAKAKAAGFGPGEKE